MKCPMFMEEIRKSGVSQEYILGSCLEERCAWYDLIGKRCAILGILVDLNAINQTLADLTNGVVGKRIESYRGGLLG